MVANRLKFALGGPLLDVVNPWLPGHPHQAVARRVGADDGRVLEVCGGTGYLARLVAESWPRTRIDVLDLSAESLAFGRRRAAAANLTGMSFVEADAGEMPMAADTYDAAVSCYGLHEIPTPQRMGAISELARVLRTGGRLIIADLDSPPGGSRLFDAFIAMTEKPHVRDVFGSGLVGELQAAGFEIVEHQPPAGFQLAPFQLIEARAA